MPCVSLTYFKIINIMNSSIRSPLINYLTIFICNDDLSIFYFISITICFIDSNLLISHINMLINLNTVFISSIYGKWNICSFYITCRSKVFMKNIALTFFKILDMVFCTVRSPLINYITSFISNTHRST